MTLKSVLMVLVPVCAFHCTQVNAEEPAGHSSALPAPVIGLIDEAQELYPDTRLDQPVKQLVVHSPRNSVAGVHVLITGLQGSEQISFSAGNAAGATIPGAQWYRLIDVPVIENTGLDRNTEKYSGMKNPYVIRRAPFRIYDPFRPVTSPMTADSSSVALRLEIPIDAAMPAGVSTYRLQIAAGNHVETLSFVINVHRATIPPLPSATISYINWHNLDNLCKAHNVEKWSEPFWSMLAKYAHTMAHGRQTAFWFQWGDYFTFDSSGTVTAFRRTLLERYIRVFLKEGLTTIHGAPMFGRRNWTSTDMLLWIPAADGKEIEAVSDKGKHMLAGMAQRIITMMTDNGWDKQWVQGLFDEPEDPFVDRYNQLVAVVRKLKPDIRILEATMTMKLSGTVNVWCPQVQEYQANQTFFDGRRAAGDKVWVYTCLSPGGPWLNRLLDMERLRQVYMGWALAKYHLDGYLHWGGNFHTDKPFEELVRPHIEGQYLPAGDSHVWYPLPDGPLSSHRFEAHRMGMEDCELLHQVDARDPARAQQIIALVVQGFDKYAKDVTAYRTARQQLLDAADAYAVR